MHRLLPILLIGALSATAGCRSAREVVPFEQGAARYAFDVRAERDLSHPGAVGLAAVTDLKTKRRLLIDRFEAPAGETSQFSATDPETGARFDLAVTVADGEASFIATVRKGGLLIASERGRHPLAP